MIDNLINISILKSLKIMINLMIVLNRDKMTVIKRVAIIVV